jgi:hypothetical protein
MYGYLDEDSTILDVEYLKKRVERGERMVMLG